MDFKITSSFFSILLNNRLVKINSAEYIIHFATKELKDGDRNYFSLRGKVVYCHPKPAEQQFNSDGTWKRDGRVEMKLSKFINAYLTDVKVKNYLDNSEITDKSLITKVINRWTELIISNSNDNEINPQISDKPSEIYRMQNHPRNISGDLDGSCMRPESGHGCKYYSEFYDMIENLKVVYETKDDKLRYRALLWQVYSETTGKFETLLDRVYGTEGVATELREWANEKGYFTKSNSHEIYPYYVEISDDAVEYLLEEGTPYMDTLISLCTCKNRIGSGICEEFGLQNSDGIALNDSGYCSCSSCGYRMHEDDAYYDDDHDVYCSSCWHDRYFYCYKCSNATSHDEGVVYEGDSYCERCAERKGIVSCEFCDDTTTDYHVTTDGECMCCYCAERKGYDNCYNCDEFDELEKVMIDGTERDVCSGCASEIIVHTHCDVIDISCDGNNCDECEKATD